MAVSIDEAGKLYFNETEVDQEELRSRIRAEREQNPEIRAVIAADGRIAHSRVVGIIDLLRQEQVTKFAINVRPQEAQ